MKTITLFVAGVFGGLSYQAFMQGQFVYCAISTVIMLVLLWFFFKRLA